MKSQRVTFCKHTLEQLISGLSSFPTACEYIQLSSVDTENCRKFFCLLQTQNKMDARESSKFLQNVSDLDSDYTHAR